MVSGNGSLHSLVIDQDLCMCHEKGCYMLLDLDFIKVKGRYDIIGKWSFHVFSCLCAL